MSNLIQRPHGFELDTTGKKITDLQLLLLVAPDEASAFAAEPLLAGGGLHHLPVAVTQRHSPQQAVELGDARPSLLPVPQPACGAQPDILHPAAILARATDVHVVPRVAPVPDAVSR